MSQIVTVLACPHCACDNLRRFGKNATGKQRYRCNGCTKTFVEQPHVSRWQDPTFEKQVLAAYQERASMRGVARQFGISRNYLVALLKKSQPTA
jgi:insertion element IS1 protein InsB